VGGADVGGGEDGVEGDAGDSGLDVGAAALFAVDQAEDSGYVHAGFAGGFDGGDGTAAGGADVVDDDHVRSQFVEAFEAAASAVRFLCFANEEAVDEGWSGAGVFGFELEGAGQFDDLVVVGKGPGAGAGDVGDEGVGSHGESAYGFGVGEMLVDEVVEDEAGETAAFGVEGGGAAVDVVVGLLAAGESEVAEFEGDGCDEVKEGGAGVCWHGLFDCRRVSPRVCLFVQSIHCRLFRFVLVVPIVSQSIWNQGVFLAKYSFHSI
jgi:hypothetical protein